MEAQYKSSTNGFETEKMATTSRSREITSMYQLFLRLLAIVITMVAAITMGVAKQTEIVHVPLLPTLPPLDIPLTSKWKYMSSNVYFMVSNCIACVYATVSLFLLIAKRPRSKALELSILIGDLLMMALLFSSDGAAAAVGMIGLKGNSHVHWMKICNVFGRFCRQLTASVVMSVIGSFLFLLMILMAILDLHKNPN
ncbi:hypothetical protein ACHQM5_026734 [Ranunculus cassubicifolius]